MTRLLVLIMSVALLAGCSSPLQRLPPALERAQAADRDARRALRTGDFAHARILFAQSLTLHQSVDDVNGAASALINLATVSHQLHDDTAAIKLLDQVLLEQARVYPLEWQITAGFRKAVILTDLGRTDEAALVLNLADQQCERNCSSRYGINVLNARLALLKGDAVTALKLAQLVSAEQDASREERANAWRIVAAVEESSNQHDAALLHYQLALELDQQLGLSVRIEQDLEGISRALAHLGRAEEAAGYARRAYLVHETTHLSAPVVATPTP